MLYYLVKEPRTYRASQAINFETAAVVLVEKENPKFNELAPSSQNFILLSFLAAI